MEFNKEQRKDLTERMAKNSAEFLCELTKSCENMGMDYCDNVSYSIWLVEGMLVLDYGNDLPKRIINHACRFQSIFQDMEQVEKV